MRLLWCQVVVFAFLVWLSGCGAGWADTTGLGDWRWGHALVRSRCPAAGGESGVGRAVRSLDSPVGASAGSGATPLPAGFWVLGGGEVFEHFPSHIAFQHPDGLADRFAFLAASFHIPFGVGVGCEAADDHLVEGMVGLPVAASVESMPDHLARRGRQGRYPAEVSERGFAFQPFRVVPGTQTLFRVAMSRVPIPSWSAASNLNSWTPIRLR